MVINVSPRANNKMYNKWNEENRETETQLILQHVKHIWMGSFVAIDADTQRIWSAQINFITLFFCIGVSACDTVSKVWFVCEWQTNSRCGCVLAIVRRPYCNMVYVAQHINRFRQNSRLNDKLAVWISSIRDYLAYVYHMPISKPYRCPARVPMVVLKP